MWARRPLSIVCLFACFDKEGWRVALASGMLGSYPWCFQRDCPIHCDKSSNHSDVVMSGREARSLALRIGFDRRLPHQGAFDSHVCRAHVPD